MNEIPDRILVVENDPLMADLISRQSLQAAGYVTQVVSDAAGALATAVQFAPDAIIANLHLPGLSAKDLMVALSAQGLEIPVVIMARKGAEHDIIQAFRIGAADYLLYPVRETEVLTVMERVLKQVHERREKENLERQIQHTNLELQSRVRELTTIYALGKAFTSITNLNQLFERIVEESVSVTQADLGWLLLLDDTSKAFILVAQRGLPADMAARLHHHPWDDGVSKLAAVSGKMLSLFGEAIQRFQVRDLGQSIIVSPIKSKKAVTGVLVVMRQAATPFSPSCLNLFDAITDFASIALSNARLFLAAEERARKFQEMAEQQRKEEKPIDQAVVRQFNKEQRDAVEVSMDMLERLSRIPAANWSAEERQALTDLQSRLESLSRIADTVKLS